MEEEREEGAETEDDMDTEKTLGRAKEATNQPTNQNIENKEGSANGKAYWTTENIANIKANVTRLREHISCPNINCTALGSLVNNGSGGSGPMAKCGACAAKITGFELKTLLESTARLIEIQSEDSASTTDRNTNGQAEGSTDELQTLRNLVTMTIRRMGRLEKENAELKATIKNLLRQQGPRSTRQMETNTTYNTAQNQEPTLMELDEPPEPPKSNPPHKHKPQ